MIDASKGFLKDGNKNRLRAQDIHKIVDTFNKQLDLPRYSRMVPMAEIASPANEYSLNIPRYIDSREPEDLHDLDAHLNGGIPDRDVDALDPYWAVFPSLRQTLFQDNGRTGYTEARVETQQVNATILDHDEFKTYTARVAAIFDAWRSACEPLLRELNPSVSPKQIIHILSEDLLQRFTDLLPLDPYDVYQRLMDYWDEIMQDDVYLIVSQGWQAGRDLRLASNKETPDFTAKRGRITSKFVGELIPAPLVIARFFGNSWQKLERLEAEVAALTQLKAEFEEEHGTDDGTLTALEGKSGITKGNVQQRAMELKEAVQRKYSEGTLEYEQAKSIKKTTFDVCHWTKNIRDEDGLFEELDILYDYLRIVDEESSWRKAHKRELDMLHKSVIAKYDELTETEIKTLVVEDKWFASIQVAIGGEVQRVTQRLAVRVKELEERYAKPLGELEREVEEFSGKVEKHLKQMGLVWT